MKKTISTLAALAVAATGAMYAGAGAADARPDAHAKKKATSFAFTGSGYGTKVRGGQVPAGSDTSAFQAFGCSNMAGIRKENFVAVEELPGAGEARQVTTRLATTTGAETASTSKSHIARVVLAEGNMGSLEITTINSVAKAFHDQKGFDTLTETTIGGVTYSPPVGDPQTFPAPTPGQPLDIPGVAHIVVGDGSSSANANSARAVADGININFIPTGTSVRIAHTMAKLERGVKSGLMKGNSLGAQSSLVGGVVQIGKTPLSIMPCRGTDGKERTKSIARLTPAPGVELRNLTSRQLGTQTASKASGLEFGRVGIAEISDAQIKLKNVVGQVNVVRKNGKMRRDIDGTDVGKVVINGQEQEFPDTDVINIPGVARLQREIVEKTNNGIHVIALRVTLFDGQGQVESILNLGEANLSIRNAN